VLYRRLWGQGNQFARVFAGKRSFERADTEPKNQGFSKTVFVRQKPSSALPLIRISQEKDAFPDMPANAHTVQWSITDVFPKALWDERSQALQTRDFQVGATIGVFRAEVETAPDSNLHLMDVAVGMHTNNQRSCRSWRYIMPTENNYAAGVKGPYRRWQLVSLEQPFHRPNIDTTNFPFLLRDRVVAALV